MVKILVVDDEPDLRYIMRRIFERLGHEVIEAADGAAALAAVYRSPPDLVITDMMMPVMGGAELIRALRGDPATALIPILAVTADAQHAGGADAVLAKPYQLQQIRAAANASLINASRSWSTNWPLSLARPSSSHRFDAPYSSPAHGRGCKRLLHEFGDD